MTKPSLANKSWAFNFLNVQPTFTQDPRPKAKGAGGVYSSEEWLESRRGRDSFYESPSLYKLRKMHWEKFNGIKSVHKLSRIFDFSVKTKIGEIGGVPFVHAWTLMELHPEMSFLLTDADGHNLLKLEVFLREHQKNFLDPKSPRTTTLQFEKFDLRTDSLEVFFGCDLLMMWGVDYALADPELEKLFAFCQSKDIPLIISTMTPMSSFRRLVFWVQRNGIVRKLFQRKKPMSLVGYYRTRKYFAALSKKSGVSCSELMKNGTYSTYLFERAQD